MSDWIPDTDQWLGGQTRVRKESPKQPPVVDEKVIIPVVARYGRTFDVIDCDNCGSLEILRYKALPWEFDKMLGRWERKKYYKCKTCTFLFKITEINRNPKFKPVA